MNYYWTYYLASMLAAYAIQNPWLAGMALGFFALRRWLPDPVVLLRTWSRVGKLKSQVLLNPANGVARRDLGRAYLELLQPRTALVYLDEARARDPESPDVAYLRGQAFLKLGDNEAALAAFGEAVGVAVDREGSLSRAGATMSQGRHADAYLGAAVALERCGRLPQAEEALAMSASLNSSAMEPLLRLAKVRRLQGDTRGARLAIENARRTWAELPGFMRRKQLAWGLRAWRASVLGA